MIRTDLAIESVDMAECPDETGYDKGYKKTEKNFKDLKITTIEILNEQGAKNIGKPIGTYITADVLPFTASVENSSEEIEKIAQEIHNILPKKGLVLVAGIGNRNITPDALGPKAASFILATRHINGEIASACGLDSLRAVAVLSPGVLGQTGIETGEIIASLVKETKPSAVIAIDALAARNLSRLGRTIQISDTGISPGSGVSNARKELSQQSLGVPVISIGVPTVVDATTLVCDMFENSTGNDSTYIREKIDRQGAEMMVTPREVDTLINRAVKITAMAINKALQPHVSVEDLTYLVS